MNTVPLTREDEALIESAVETNERAFDPEFLDGAHIVAAAVRTADGSIYDGASLPANVGRASVCAEPAAIGSAVADGYRHDAIRTCVAVAYPMPDHDADDPRVIPPCGACRELLADLDEDLRVIVPAGGELGVRRAIDLLPVRTW